MPLMINDDLFVQNQFSTKESFAFVLLFLFIYFKSSFSIKSQNLAIGNIFLIVLVCACTLCLTPRALANQCSEKVAIDQILQKLLALENRFFIEMKRFDDNNPLEPDWLKNIQTKYKCCGGTGPSDYKEFFKPASCCDEKQADLKRCLKPPLQMEGNIGESPTYFSQGCLEFVTKTLESFDEAMSESKLDTSCSKSYLPLIKRLLQDYHIVRKNIFDDMKKFDDDGEEKFNKTILNNIQAKFKCCGFHSPRDYKEFFKPKTCCDLASKRKDLLEKCFNPPKQTKDGNVGDSPEYYAQGCSPFLLKNSQSFNEVYKEIFNGKARNQSSFILKVNQVEIVFGFFIIFIFQLIKDCAFM